MIFRNKTARYTVVPNVILEDERLSWEEKGLMAYLLSKPDNWNVSPAHLAKEGRAKRDKIYSMLRLLESCGYIEKKKRSSGHVEWHIYDSPKPNTENPDEGKPDPSEPTLINTESKVITESKTPPPAHAQARKLCVETR